MNCQGCGLDLNGPDRFCRNCGAPVASLVGELDDTLRFSRASGRLGMTEPQLPTNPFYQPPQTPEVVRKNSPVHWFASLLAKIKFLPANVLWLAFLLLVVLMGTAGVTIGRGVLLAHREARRHRVEQARRAAQRAEEQRTQREATLKKSATDSVQNGLGFVPAEVPKDPYPELAGVFVESLTSDASPAAVAHIQAGDVITELNNQAVSNIQDLMAAIKPLTAGSEASVKIFRDGQVLDVRLTAADPAHEPFKQKIEPTTQGFLGLGDVGRRCCVPGTKVWGLEIKRIVDNSSADLAGLQTGDVIIEFDGRPVRTAEELTRRIRAAAPRSKVPIKFYRGDTQQTIEVLIGHQSE